MATESRLSSSVALHRVLQISVSLAAGFVLGVLATVLLLRQPISEEAVQIVLEDLAPEIAAESKREWEAAMWMNRALELTQDYFSFSEAGTLDELECTIRNQLHADYIRLKQTWQSNETTFGETDAQVIQSTIRELANLNEKPSCARIDNE